jgi:hypothetical protein
MRLFPVGCVLASVLVGCCVQLVGAQEPSLQARLAARRELELAKIDLRNYWQIEYPRQKRELDTAIEMTRAEICANEEAQRDLRPFTRFSLGEPFPLTIRELQICGRGAELRLRNLEVERNALIRFHYDDFHVLEMRVQEARLRVVELEVNDVIASDSPAK